MAVASIVLKELAFRLTIRVGTRLKSQVLIANAWHHRSDALSSIAALAGVLGRGLHSSTSQLNLSRVCHTNTPYTPYTPP